MGLLDSDRIDSAAHREGWTVLSIYHFEDWAALDDPAELLRAKLKSYDTFLESLRFRLAHHATPVRVELHASEPAPASVRAVCAASGVTLLDPTTVPESAGD